MRVRRRLSSAVGTATGYQLDDRAVGVELPLRSFLFSVSSRPALGTTQPPLQWVPETLFLGIKRQEGESYHSLPASAEMKETCIYTSTLPIHLHGVVLS
jgi:hypothetical protein